MNISKSQYENIELSMQSKRDLVVYLLAYEHDIAISEEGFGFLQGLFLDVIGRKPNERI